MWLDLLIAWFAVFLFMSFFWFIGRIIRNYAVVDIAWSFSFLIIALVYYTVSGGFSQRKFLMVFIVGTWSFRLGWYLLWRILGHREDHRYTEFRTKYEKEGGNVDRKFFTNIFQFQGILSVFLSLPFLIYANDPSIHFHSVEIIGFFLWLIGILGETLSDLQLMKFKSVPENKGKVCNYGLWNYSRHPNYFFEWLIWVSFSVVALSSPSGYFSIISPVLMLLFLTKVTGIPITERHAIERKGQAYIDYQKTTSAFVPWFKNTRSGY
jgi:steroid 5-alpha reductase family enzyme